MPWQLLQDPSFLRLLVSIDQDFADQVRAAGCSCGGVLHLAIYPRKPRGLERKDRADFCSRLSFCCSVCRKRSTSMSVRFLGRRVYVMLSVVLMSTRAVERMPAAASLSKCLAVPMRTLGRWREWWTAQFPQTSLWQAAGARFMPPPAVEQFPASLLERFVGSPAEALLRFLVFLSPLSVRPIALNGGH